MTLVKLGYVAMSVYLKNSSPSQTMTYAQFEKLKDREAAIKKLERIAISNLDNCLRLMKHNLASDITFFRLSSKLIPLANHEALAGWNYMNPLQEKLHEIRSFLKEHPMRIDFHPDHFVLLNSTKSNILKNSVKTLSMHKQLLEGMGIPLQNRCVLHVGGGHRNKEKSLEQFIHNWGYVPVDIQQMIMLENDDTVFNVEETLYLCEKLQIPLVFDLHHHLANHNTVEWEKSWDRIIGTWKNADLPIKMHISSPKSEKDFRSHAEYIDPDMFLQFLRKINGTVDEIHCMIEAKKKDDALVQLMKAISTKEGIEKVNQSSFKLL
jgi:UV DNA damage endonuclease